MKYSDAKKHGTLVVESVRSDAASCFRVGLLFGVGDALYNRLFACVKESDQATWLKASSLRVESSDPEFADLADILGNPHSQVAHLTVSCISHHHNCENPDLIAEETDTFSIRVVVDCAFYALCLSALVVDKGGVG